MKRKKSLFSNCIFMAVLAFRLDPAVIWLQAGLTVLKALMIYLPILIVRTLLNEITAGNPAGCLQSVLLLAGTTLAGNALVRVLEVYSEKHMEITLKKIQAYLGKAVMKMPFSELEKPQMRDFILLAQEGGNLAELFEGFSALVTGIVTLAGLTGIIFTVQPVILLLVAAVVAVRIWSDGRNRKLWEKWRPRYAPVMRRINYFFHIMKSVDYGKEIRLYHLGEWLHDKIVSISSKEYMKTTTEHNVELQRNHVPSEFAMVLQELVVYLFLGYRVVFRGMPIGDFSMYMSSIQAFSDGMRGIVDSVAALLEYGLFLENFRYCVWIGEQEKGEEKDLPGTGDALFQNSRFRQAEKAPLCLEFSHVSFSYPNTDRMVLKDISLTIREGESLSIVGENGAGKTTFVKLLCRLYEPTEGRILLNGVDIQKIPHEAYMAVLGVVFQDYRLYAFSMEENITMGEKAEEGRVMECVEKSGLSDKLDSLPEGLKTNISKEFDENGVEFSGGEGQKLALARVLYKNPRLFVLDEPTSALDPLAEYEMFHRFHELVKGKCAVYISHRLSSTRFTDRIAVLDQGRLAEYGSHQELMNIPEGIYAGMFRVQAGYYM